MQANIFEDISIDVIKSISKFNNEPTWMLKYRLESLRKFQDSPVEKSNLFTKYSELANKLEAAGDIEEAEEIRELTGKLREIFKQRDPDWRNTYKNDQ